MEKTNIKLNDLSPGERAVVKRLENRGSMRRRLIDLGFAPKSEAVCLGISPLGDPKAFYIKGTVIALREEDSNKIVVTKLSDKTN